jgi:crossover junction endodeoxyribonuclease RuvC
MIRAQLHLRETPPADAADALAAAITHFQSSAAARATEREKRRV